MSIPTYILFHAEIHIHTGHQLFLYGAGWAPTTTGSNCQSVRNGPGTSHVRAFPTHITPAGAPKAATTPCMLQHWQQSYAESNPHCSIFHAQSPQQTHTLTRNVVKLYSHSRSKHFPVVREVGSPAAHKGGILLGALLVEIKDHAQALQKKNRATALQGSGEGTHTHTHTHTSPYAAWPDGCVASNAKARSLLAVSSYVPLILLRIHSKWVRCTG